MNPNNPIFAHQIELILRLSEFFSEITVITADYHGEKLPKNVRVEKYDWVQGNPLRSTFNFYSKFLRLITSSNFDLVFSHMVDTQALLASPILKLKRLPHIFWYAHAKKSIRGWIATNLSDQNITSTKGSYPYDKSKVKFLGQSIDVNNFRYVERKNFPLKNFIHIGRIDASKRIEILIKLTKYFDSHLDLWGRTIPGSYLNGLQNLVADSGNLISLCGPIPRKAVPQKLYDSDLFIHAFEGSLDKSLIEATAVGCPVITLNQEYIKEFGSWSDCKNTNDVDFLLGEFSVLKQLSPESIQNELLRKRLIVENKHSLENWIAGFLRTCDEVLIGVQKK